VCGPSGSGKTSLVMALLGMIDITEGRIIVDELDLSTVPRNELRSRINVIPQDPFFMPGTMRFNLDPHNRISDEDICTALQRVGLWGRVSANGGLDMVLSASEWSVGQRQLICLARALLVESSILVLDEATSR
jgi:ATP-binding cassette, subfamily C (CFTR/MRP), member 1